MAHRNARTTVRTRMETGLMRAAGCSLGEIAQQLGTSKPTVAKWAQRFADGDSLEDRSSRPRLMPRLTPPEVAAIVEEMRRETELGPAMLAGYLGLPASTVHKIAGTQTVPHVPSPTRLPS